VTDEFLRIVLDEAHNIKNRTALVSKACYELKGQRRWALTGMLFVDYAELRLTSAKVPL
jgi:DNA repair protein RAD5